MHPTPEHAYTKVNLTNGIYSPISFPVLCRQALLGLLWSNAFRFRLWCLEASTAAGTQASIQQTS